MAALKLLLSQARRHCLTSRHSHFHSSLFLGSRRSLCSSSSASSSSSQPDESDSKPPPPRGPSPTISIQPVSYPVKPKDPSPPDTTESSEAPLQNQSPAPPPPRLPRGPTLTEDTAESRRAWTREDIRYVKDAPSISPVSYPLRVAPLPEDKATAGAEAGKDDGTKANEEIDKESRKIRADDQLKRRVIRVAEEEKVRVPFPTLMKVKQKEKPPIFDLTEAIRQVKANAKAKFDETVEVHVRLAIESKRTELAVRGTMILPHGAPKAVSVAVFAEGADAEEARAAGADIVGGKELIEEIANGNNKLRVDKCFSTPGMAPHLGKIAQYLRKRRLMPDKKLGTLTNDIPGQLKELRQGRVEFKMESKSIVHAGIGKLQNMLGMCYLSICAARWAQDSLFQYSPCQEQQITTSL
ncbi:50S ribosomal protein L1, chloroplastic isoform X2 [Prosopis cineraria]|uniref:50S ribosomal protein L1, chloroplastic isoform X2 n=1 Tax=Prosopis cineraria TaxID=364024 RepID=UPI00240F6727|nr:50S ribosomal protein L1, chloroplastic isoform X2 [Prosopis cineraria]